MSRIGVIGLLIFTAALLQTALFPHLTLAGFRPDLLLLLTAAFAVRDGPMTGTAVGFSAGIMSDLLLAQPPVGLSAIVMLGIGYAVGILRPYLATGSVTAPLLVALTTGVAGTVAYGLLSRLLGDPRFTVPLVLQASLLVGFYNTLLAPPLFNLVGSLSTRFPPERSASL